jgi:serine/threonine protein kinase
MSDKTVLESDKTILETLNDKTTIETDKTIIEDDINVNNDNLSLQTFRSYEIVNEFEIMGSEADTFLIKKDEKEFFLKLYRRGVKVNEELLELIYKLSKEYEYFNEIIEFGYDEKLKRYYEVSKYLSKGIIKELDFNNRKSFIKQLNEALNILHKNNIIHRDLKPTNILIQEDNPLKIGDRFIVCVSPKKPTTDISLIFRQIL